MNHWEIFWTVETFNQCNVFRMIKNVSKAKQFLKWKTHKHLNRWIFLASYAFYHWTSLKLRVKTNRHCRSLAGNNDVQRDAVRLSAWTTELDSYNIANKEVDVGSILRDLVLNFSACFTYIIEPLLVYYRRSILIPSSNKYVCTVQLPEEGIQDICFRCGPVITVGCS